MANMNNFYKMFMDNNVFNQNKSFLNPMNVQHLATIANKNLEIMVEGSKVMAKNSQAIMSDQVEVAQKNFSNLMKKTQEVMSSTNQESNFDRTVNLFKSFFDQTVDNMKDLAEKATKSNTEIFDLVSSKISENIAECSNCASEVVHNAAHNMKKKAA